MTRRPSNLRDYLTGGDRRSIARSRDAEALVRKEPARVREIVALTTDSDWLIVQRALDLLEKLAQDRPDWVEPYKQVFIGPLADDEHWEIRLQIVRALPLFTWSAEQARRVEAVLIEGVGHPRRFVQAWSLDSLAKLARRRRRLAPTVEKHLIEFEASDSKALRARARAIRSQIAPSIVTLAPRDGP